MSEVQTASAVPGAPERSWWPFAGAIALAVVVGAGLLGTYGLVIYRLRHSAAGREAVAELRVSPQLQQLLGEPLRLYIEGGDLQHDGEASLTVRARGPRGHAQVELESRAEGKSWHIVKGSITTASGQELPLQLAPPAVPPNPAPPSNSSQSPPNGRGPQP